MIREGKKIPPDYRRKIPVVIERISNDTDIVALFAFGSLSADRINPLSDLDFGILLSEKLNSLKRFDKHLDLIGTFNTVFRTDEIDLVLMNDAPMKFCYEILKTGKLLQCRHPAKLVDYSEKIVKLYLDFKYFRDGFDKAFLEGIGYHG